MHFATILKNCVRGCATNGCRATFVSFAGAAQERFFEWRYGIATQGVVHLDKFGLSAPGRNEYGATLYRDFRLLMKKLKVYKCEDVFLDYGAGLGRSVILAATYPFKKVIGVELSKELTEQAVRNIEMCRTKLACKDIQCIADDATAYEVPMDVSVIFFNNPFYSDILDRVLDKIRQSVQRDPRKLIVICNLPIGSIFENQVRGADWLTLECEMSLSVGRKGLIFHA